MLKEECKVKGIISLPTGVGKTLLAACITRNLLKSGKIKGNQHVLVLAPRIVIQDQIACEESDFNKIFRDLPVFVKKVEGSETKGQHLIKLLKENETQIIVASPQLINLFELDKSTAVNTLIKAVILDEVHHTYNGPNISRTIRSIVENSDFVIGLSATPTKEAVENIGKVLYYYSIKDAMKEGMLLGNIKFYKYDTIIEKAKYVDTGKECEDPWEVAIKERAEKYADKILEVFSKERDETGQDRFLKTAIACPNVTEAEIFYEILVERLGGKSLYRAHYKVEEAQNEVKRFKSDKEGILVCVNMIDIGFDDRELEMLVIARKLNSPIAYAQLRERVLRKPINDWNIKKIKNYAIILDLAGNVDRLQGRDEQVAQGRLEAKGFLSDLRGLQKAKKATANVKLKEEGLEFWPSPEIRTEEVMISKEMIGHDQEFRNIIDLLHMRFDEGFTEIYLSSKDLNYVTFKKICDFLSKKGFLINCEKIYYQNGTMYVGVRKRS